MSNNTTVVNAAFEDDDDDEIETRIGFEPSLDDIDEGVYTNDNTESSGHDVVPDKTSKCSRCSRCWSCLSITKREIISTTNDVITLAKEQCRPSQPGLKNCALDFFQNRFPCLKWIPKYKLKQLKGDIIAGITTGLSVLPQGLAYGQIVEVPAQHGLYSSIMGSYSYAVLGGCKDIAVGPSAVVSIVTAEYGTGRAPVPMNYIYSSILAFFSGIILISMGLLRLGFLFSFVSLPVLKAFRAAAGITIFMSRIKKWWGLLDVPRQFLPQLYWSLKRISETNLYDLGVGALCILLLFTFKKIVREIFWILGTERNIIVIIIGGSILYALLKIGIPITHTPDIPRGVPWPQIPNFTLKYTDNNNTLEKSFLEIANDIGTGFFFVPMVIMFECISAGKTLARKGNYKFDYNVELIAMGVSNLLTSLLRGHPITGAFLRTGINFNAGVQTPAGGILAATIVIASLYLVYPLFYYIPVCTMAATIMMGAIDVCTFHKFGITWVTNKVEIVPYLVTFITSLTLGIEFGVFFGVAVQSAISLLHFIRPKLTNQKKEGVLRISPLERFAKLEFWSADALTDHFLEVDTKDDQLKTIEIDLKGVLRLDTSTIQCFKILNERCAKNSVQLQLVNVEASLKGILGKTGLKYEIDDSCVFDNIHNKTSHNNSISNGINNICVNKTSELNIITNDISNNGFNSKV